MVPHSTKAQNIWCVWVWVWAWACNQRSSKASTVQDTGGNRPDRCCAIRIERRFRNCTWTRAFEYATCTEAMGLQAVLDLLQPETFTTPAGELHGNFSVRFPHKTRTGLQTICAVTNNLRRSTRPTSQSCAALFRTSYDR